MQNGGERHHAPDEPHVKKRYRSPRFGIVLGLFLDRFGIVLGAFWDRFGIVLGSFWIHFGVVLAPFFDMGFDWCVVSPAAVLRIRVLTASGASPPFFTRGGDWLAWQCIAAIFACNGCNKEMRG